MLFFVLVLDTFLQDDPRSATGEVNVSRDQPEREAPRVQYESLCQARQEVGTL